MKKLNKSTFHLKHFWSNVADPDAGSGALLTPGSNPVYGEISALFVVAVYGIRDPKPVSGM
jgi:hypothetical protein